MDREKVIKGLECCSKHDGSECPQCPYFNGECTDDLMADALLLLKEQDADIKNLNETIMNLLQKITEMKMIYGDCELVGELVRCKDCKYYDYHNGCMSWHDVNSKNDNWYCADGERRMDDA